MKLIKRTKTEQTYIDLLNKEARSRSLLLGRHLRPVIEQWNPGARRLIIESLIDDFERNEKMSRGDE